MSHETTADRICRLRATLGPVRIKAPRSDVTRTLTHGWLLPALLTMDAMTYGRWDYWQECTLARCLPDRPIPSVDFLSTPDPGVWKMLLACLDAIPNQGTGGWQGWSGWTYFRYFLEWLLFGFGHAGQPALPDEPAGCEGASMRLYQICNIAAWILWPHDYLGNLLAENAYGKHQGFFPTPHSLVELMTQITINGSGLDTRTQTVCDPCVGTGRMLLHASNHSLRLYGMEIDATLCQATLVNGYLYAPWLVHPLPWLDGMQYQPAQSEALAEAMAAQSPPHVAATLAETEHDPSEQWRFEPIKKRRRKDESDARQGRLF